MGMYLQTNNQLGQFDPASIAAITASVQSLFGLFGGGKAKHEKRIINTFLSWAAPKLARLPSESDLGVLQGWIREAQQLSQRLQTVDVGSIHPHPTLDQNVANFKAVVQQRIAQVEQEQAQWGAASSFLPAGVMASDLLPWGIAAVGLYFLSR